MSYREFAALQKWRHGHTLKPEDVEGLGLSPDAMILQPKQVPGTQKGEGTWSIVNQLEVILSRWLKRFDI
jgi:hypothetical protein